MDDGWVHDFLSMWYKYENILNRMEPPPPPALHHLWGKRKIIVSKNCQIISHSWKHVWYTSCWTTIFFQNIKIKVILLHLANWFKIRGANSKLSTGEEGGGDFFEGILFSFGLVVHSWEAINTLLFWHIFLNYRVLIDGKCLSLWECCNSNALGNFIDYY